MVPLRISQTFGDGVAVPAGPVLVAQPDEGAVGGRPGGSAGVGEQEQGEQRGGLAVLGDQLVKHAGDLDASLRGVGSDEVVPGMRNVPGRVQQVQGVQHRGKPVRQLVRPRGAVGDAGRRDLLLGSGDPGLHGGLADQEGGGDLHRAEPADQAEGQGGPRLGSQSRMAAGEDQSEPVVRQVVEGGGVLVEGAARRVDEVVGDEERQLAREGGRPSPALERLAHGDGGQPGAGAVGDAVMRPADEGLGEGVLSAVLGGVEVTGDVDDGREDPSPLQAVCVGDSPVDRGPLVSRHRATADVLRHRRRAPGRRRPGPAPRPGHGR